MHKVSFDFKGTRRVIYTPDEDIAILIATLIGVKQTEENKADSRVEVKNVLMIELNTKDIKF